MFVDLVATTILFVCNIKIINNWIEKGNKNGLHNINENYTITNVT